MFLNRYNVGNAYKYLKIVDENLYGEYSLFEGENCLFLYF